MVVFYETFKSSYAGICLGRIDDLSGLVQSLGQGDVPVTFTAGLIRRLVTPERRACVYWLGIGHPPPRAMRRGCGLISMTNNGYLSSQGLNESHQH